jgi:hypothetical protein
VQSVIDCALVNPPAWISAASALAAFVFSGFVYWRTRYLSEPKERPTISINRIDTVSGPDDRGKWGTNILYHFMNTGQHPARNVRMKIGRCTASNVAAFSFEFDQSQASDLFPNEFRINQHTILRGPAHQFPAGGLVGAAYPDTETHLIYMNVTYLDAFFPRRKKQQEFWFVLNPGADRVQFATVEQRESFAHVVKAR